MPPTAASASPLGDGAMSSLPPSGDGTDLAIRFDKSVPILVMPEGRSFEDLRAWLRVALPAHLPTLNGQTCRLDFGTRDIVLFDLRRLVSFLRQEFGIEVTGLYVLTDVVARFAERELKLKLFVHAPAADTDATEMFDEGSHAVVAATPVGAPARSDSAEDESAFTPVPTASRDDGGRRTLPVHRTLRSGAQIRFDGDVHVFGDVNPGAHVVATGNILIYGALKGVAHAGAHGDAHAFILAFDMRPTQLRIARKIAIPSPKPPTTPSKAAPSSVTPEVAILRDDQVHVEPFKGRVPA